MSTVVIYKGANILSLPYKEEGNDLYFDFKPGNNKITSKVWKAVCTSNKKRMEHYGKYLKEVKTEVPKEESPDVSKDDNDEGDEVINPSDYNADKAIGVIEGCMELEELKKMQELESAGKDRTTVISAIEKQVEEVKAFHKKIDDEKGN